MSSNAAQKTREETLAMLIVELESAILRLSASAPAPIARNIASDLSTAVFMWRSDDPNAAVFYLNRWLEQDQLKGEIALAIERLGGDAAQKARSIKVIHAAYAMANHRADLLHNHLRSNS